MRNQPNFGAIFRRNVENNMHPNLPRLFLIAVTLCSVGVACPCSDAAKECSPDMSCCREGANKESEKTKTAPQKTSSAHEQAKGGATAKSHADTQSQAVADTGTAKAAQSEKAAPQG